jgi:glutamyl-tRNA reductase
MTIRGFREISSDFEAPSGPAQAVRTEERARLADLRIHGWDTASLSSGALMALEAEIPAALGWRAGVPIVTCQRYEFLSLDPTTGGTAPRTYEGETALLHLAALAAGLDSLVLGETQVFGQVRGAIARSTPELRRIAAPALAAARSLRREEEFAEHAGYALDQALAHAGIEPGGRLLVLGGGVMARRVLERAVQLGFEVTIAARRPVTLALPATYEPLERVGELAPFDVVAGCLGAGAPRMDAASLPSVMRLAVDLGTPRNLSDDFEAPVVTIADLLDYQQNTPALQERRDALRARLQELLTQRLTMASTDGGSPLGSLRGEVEVIRQRELARAARLHPELPLSALDTITRSLVNQIFHRPSLRLRRSANTELAEALAALFKAPGSLETADDGE